MLHSSSDNPTNSLFVSTTVSVTEIVFFARASSTDIKLNFAMYSFRCASRHSNQTSGGTARCAAIFVNSYWSLKPITANASSCWLGCTSSKKFLVNSSFECCAVQFWLLLIVEMTLLCLKEPLFMASEPLVYGLKGFPCESVGIPAFLLAFKVIVLAIISLLSSRFFENSGCFSSISFSFL